MNKYQLQKAFEEAVHNFDTANIVNLIGEGADVNFENGAGLPPLAQALHIDHSPVTPEKEIKLLKTVELLLEAGADPVWDNKRDFNSFEGYSLRRLGLIHGVIKPGDAVYNALGRAADKKAPLLKR